MKLEGKHTLPATATEVWSILADPERLSKLLPGCERLDPDGIDRYKVAVKFGLAAISGKMSGNVALLEKDPPKSFRLDLESRGLTGFVKGSGRIKLTEKEGETEVSFSGEAQVGGMIAAVGQRLIEGAAKKMIEEFFQRAADQLKDS